MQTYQKKPQVTPQANVQARAPLADTSAMNALWAGTAPPTADMLGHKVDLPGALRARMESSFGADLSGLQLYESQAVADAGAEAITQGSHIAFAPGKLDFASTGGRALLGHEISHAVSQARGEVTGNGFLQSHVLEARADREGMLAAMGQPISAASAAGPMQAKKNKETAPQTQQVETAPAPQGHQIDAGKMNFDKWAYRKDSDYQALQGLISDYNASNENPEAEMALMNAAMAYINQNSTGRTAIHKGRTANAEDILYQLSMKGGTAAHADQNADALITAAQTPVGVDNLSSADRSTYIDDSTRVFSGLKNVYQEGSGYSPALQMITANVLADQNASGHTSAPTYQPTSGDSGATVSFDPGSPGFEGAHHYNIRSRAHGTSMNDSMGTTLHELTHIANGEAYQNTSLFFSAEKGSNLAKRRNKRLKNLMALDQSLPTAAVAQIADQNGGQQSLSAYHQDRLGYAAGDKVLAKYVGEVPQAATHDLARAYAEKAFDSPKEQESFADKLGNLGHTSYSKALQLMQFASTDDNTQLDLGPNWIVPSDFRQMLSPSDRIDAARHSSMISDTMQNITSLVNPQQESDRISNGYLDTVHQQLGDVGDNFSNTLVEYDSVINQMLLQYENAGQQEGQTPDTGSQYYRMLKAMALQSHVDRQNAKLKRRIPA